MICDVRLKKPQYRLVKKFKIDDIVAELYTAKKFRTLGGCQDSFFYWRTENSQTFSSIKLVNEKGEEFDTEELTIKYYSTFTASELGIFLPRTIFKDNDYHYLEFRKYNEYIVSYIGEETIRFSSINEAESRLLMVNFLLSKRILTLV